MGYIVLNTVTFSPVPSGTQTVNVDYKLSSSGTWISFVTGATVLANGTFSPSLTITGLIDGEQYDIRVTNQCGSSPYSEQISIGTTTTTTTTTTSTSTTTTTTTTVCPSITDLTGTGNPGSPV